MDHRSVCFVLRCYSVCGFLRGWIRQVGFRMGGSSLQPNPVQWGGKCNPLKSEAGVAFLHPLVLHGVSGVPQPLSHRAFVGIAIVVSCRCTQLRHFEYHPYMVSASTGIPLAIPVASHPTVNFLVEVLYAILAFWVPLVASAHPRSHACSTPCTTLHASSSSLSSPSSCCRTVHRERSCWVCALCED